MPYDIGNGSLVATFFDNNPSPGSQSPCYDKWSAACGANNSWLSAQRQWYEDYNSGAGKIATAYNLGGLEAAFIKAVDAYFKCKNAASGSPGRIAPTPIDLYIDAVEFTQATQISPIVQLPITLPLNPGVPLIERKDLSIRVYLGVHGAANTIPPGTQFAGELVISGLPKLFSVTGPVDGTNVTTDDYQSTPPASGNDKNKDQRSSNGQSLIFSIPAELCVGTLNANLTVYPLTPPAPRVTANFDVPPDHYQWPRIPPRALPIKVLFRTVKPLRIQPVLVAYTGFVEVPLPSGTGGPAGKPHLRVLKTQTAILDDALQALDWVKKVYPISDLIVEPPLAVAWNLDITQPQNLWALRQTVASLRTTGDNSTIYVGFLSPDIFPLGAFKMPRGIGWVGDHTALTIARNGPATAHAIGRALGLLIINCQTPIPDYATPISVETDWIAHTWRWAGGEPNPIRLSPTGPTLAWLPPTYDSQQDPPEPGFLKLTDGIRSATIYRNQDEWLPNASGCEITISTDVTAVNVLEPQDLTKLLPVVSVSSNQGFSGTFTVNQEVNILILDLTLFPNEKSGVNISVSGGGVVWVSDLLEVLPPTNPPTVASTPVSSASSTPYNYTNQFALDSNGVPVKLSPNTTYVLAIDADITVDSTTSKFAGSAGASNSGIQNSLQATSWTKARFQFVPTGVSGVPTTPISETPPPSGNLPAGTIQETGLDNQQFWVYDPNVCYDFMSFCNPPWVSPYTYLNLLAKIDAL